MGVSNLQSRTVAIVIPAYNEEACIPELVRRLRRVFESEKKFDFRCYLVENGSEDTTWELIQAIAESDPRFIGIQLSRNFGADGGITAGLSRVTEDAAVLMTADLQDPPECIPLFLREWEKGIENVYGVVLDRGGTGRIRRVNSRIFYKILTSLAEYKIPENASDFRLLDRRAYEAVRDLPERARFMRGLSAWVGFSSIGIPVSRPERFGGESKATTAEVMKVASRGVLSNTTKPLRLITVSGIVMSLTSVALLVFLTVLWIVRGVPFAGFGTLVAISLLVFGVLAFMLGVVSEYVGLIYEEVKQRPSFIVKQQTSDIKNER
jgi:polyisoprenyl-phosphate glycosyltransferase